LIKGSNASDREGENLQVLEAQKLKDDGVTMVAIGIGSEKVREILKPKLTEMSSINESDEPLYFGAEFKDLESNVNALVQVLCG
uniref:hypothetical protein n=1 Tax=Salmonella sp. s54412 TaxID=3160128 RepID=UPI0037543D12